MIAITMSVSFLMIVNRTARSYKQEIPQTSIIHTLWVRSSALYFQSFPDGQGFKRSVLCVQTVFIHFWGDILGGISYCIFGIERVWRMIFGLSASEKCAEIIKEQRVNLDRLQNVKLLYEKIFGRLRTAAQESSQLANALAVNFEKMTAQPSDQTDLKSEIEQELTTIHQVLGALITKAQELSGKPDHLANLKSFQLIMQTQIDNCKGVSDQVPILLAHNEQIEEIFEAAAQKLEQAADSIALALVELFVPRSGNGLSNLNRLKEGGDNDQLAV